MSGVLRVVVADDHVPTRQAVREALEQQDCEVMADVGSAQAAVAAAVQHRPDVCLLDIHMPGSGIVAAADITRALPETTVVMLTASGDDEDLFAALRAGASGYLAKGMDPARLGHHADDPPHDDHDGVAPVPSLNLQHQPRRPSVEHELIGRHRHRHRG